MAISKSGWDRSDYIILARGDDFADAICAVPLSKKYDCPILLTHSERLHDFILDEIKRLAAKHALIIGGTGAVSMSNEDTLRELGIKDIKRIAGADRYETSVKIAEQLGEFGTVAIATGADYPDALSISSIAASKGMPILLTEKDRLHHSVRKLIQNKPISSTYIIGGRGAVDDSIASLMPNNKRLGGKDRFETNVLVMNEFMDEMDFRNIYAVGGESADTLTGAGLAAKTNSPFMLICNTFNEVTVNFLKSIDTQVSRLMVFGREVVVNDILQYIIIQSEPQRTDSSAANIEVADINKTNIVLSCDDVSDGIREEGEVLTFRVNADLVGSAYPQGNIAYIMKWTKNGAVVDSGDIKISCSEANIMAVDGDEGVYKIGVSHSVSGHEAYTIKGIFNNAGLYNLEVFAIKE